MVKLENIKLEIFDTAFEPVKRIEDFDGWYVHDVNDFQNGEEIEPGFYLYYKGKNKTYSITIGKAALKEIFDIVTVRSHVQPEKVAYGSFAEDTTVQKCCGEGCCRD